MKNLSRAQRWGVGLLLACTLGSLVHAAETAKNQRRIVPLAGTTWSGTDSDGDHYVFTFEQDGTLAYKSPTGSYRNGKWKQFRNAVYLEMNDRHSEYLGEIDGNTIRGKAWNVKRRAWLWKVTRDK